MTVFDLIVLSLVGASVIAGAMRGLVRAAVTTAALIVGVFVAAQGYEWAAGVLRALGVVETKAAADACGFLALAGLALAAGFAAGEVARSGLKRARMQWLDRSFGALFGLARGLAVCSVVFLALTAFPVRLESVAEARTAPALEVGAGLLARLAPSAVSQRFLAGRARPRG